MFNFFTVGKIDFNDLNLDRRYHPLLAYARSKLCNILFTTELARRLEGKIFIGLLKYLKNIEHL